jgi:hypothetical protein
LAGEFRSVGEMMIQADGPGHPLSPGKGRVADSGAKLGWRKSGPQSGQLGQCLVQLSRGQQDCWKENGTSAGSVQTRNSQWSKGEGNSRANVSEPA